MANKTISLDVFDRITIKKFLQEQEQVAGGIGGFSLADVRVALSLLNKVEFTDEEIESFKISAKDTIISWEGNDSKDFSFSKSEKELLSNIINSRKNWEIDRRNLNLVNKFDISETILRDKNKPVELSFYDRLTLRSFIINQNGKIQSILKLTEIFDILENINITQEEVVEYNITDSGSVTQWNNEKLVTISFTSDQYALLKECIENNERFYPDSRLLALLDKFEIKIPEEPEEEDE